MLFIGGEVIATGQSFRWQVALAPALCTCRVRFVFGVTAAGTSRFPWLLAGFEVTMAGLELWPLGNVDDIQGFRLSVGFFIIGNGTGPRRR